MGVFVFSLVISLLCIWASTKMLSIYFKVKAWKKTMAIVISKKIELHKKVSVKNAPYAVRVEYKYVVDGNEYLNDKVYLVELLGGQANHMESSAKKIIDKFRDEIEVRVDPKDPQRSVVFCTGVIMNFFILFIGIISLLIGISFL